MLAGGTVSNCFDLTPHDKLVAPFFRQLGMALGYVVWIYLNIFESERYFGIKKPRDFISKENLENDHCYLGLRPTVDTALIPLLSHPVLRTKPNA